eukprot:353133-Chlamydomonas_euryale.AAC.5
MSGSDHLGKRKHALWPASLAGSKAALSHTLQAHPLSQALMAPSLTCSEDMPLLQGACPQRLTITTP